MQRATRHGFTLVECAIVCAVTAILATVALPALNGHALRTARLDAVQALTRVHATQEQYRSLHGLYAGELSALRGVAAVSEQGRYTVAIELTGPDAYRATARARGVQLSDHDCPALTLDVSLGFTTAGPGPQCWNR